MSDFKNIYLHRREEKCATSPRASGTQKHKPIMIGRDASRPRLTIAVLRDSSDRLNRRYIFFHSAAELVCCVNTYAPGSLTIAAEMFVVDSDQPPLHTITPSPYNQKAFYQAVKCHLSNALLDRYKDIFIHLGNYEGVIYVELGISVAGREDDPKDYFFLSAQEMMLAINHLVPRCITATSTRYLVAPCSVGE